MPHDQEISPAQGQAAAAESREAAAELAVPAVVTEPAGLLEMIGDAFVAFDRQLRYTYVNARAAELLGRCAADLVGKLYDDEYPEAAATPFAVAYRRALETQKAERFES